MEQKNYLTVNWLLIISGGRDIMNEAEKMAGMDREWVALIKEAKMLGLTIDDIRIFLLEHQKSEQI